MTKKTAGTFSFDKDIDIISLMDNLDRPVTELFITIVNKGYIVVDLPATPQFFNLNGKIDEYIKVAWVKNLGYKLIKKIELEITSDCNAACPGCARTLNKDILQVTSFTLEDLKRIFPTTNHIANKEFKFCGVLGDPAIHPQFADMIEYLLQHGGRTSISTNGAVGSVDMWRRVGSLANQYHKTFFIQWCIDGHKETNHIYRVNTKWNVLERNINAFCETVGEYTHRAQWVFIVFDHNEHELDIAKQHAKRLGFKFATRTGMRNSYNNWVAELGKKNNKQKKVITTTGDKEHKRKDEVYKLDKLHEEAVVSIIANVRPEYIYNLSGPSSVHDSFQNPQIYLDSIIQEQELYKNSIIVVYLQKMMILLLITKHMKK